ncbi:hypothetical protein HMPREF3204_00571 [Gardnerella pickettii]|nr:hypothetical protein HMPREF3204_00571 [Gardnerella pickettii]
MFSAFCCLFCGFELQNAENDFALWNYTYALMHASFLLVVRCFVVCA